MAEKFFLRLPPYFRIWMTAPPLIWRSGTVTELCYSSLSCCWQFTTSVSSRSLLEQLKRNVLNQWRPVRKCFLPNIPCIPHCQTFIALKISKDFVNPHSAVVKYDKTILHLFSHPEDSSHLTIVNDNFFSSDRCDMSLGLEDGRVPDPLIRASSFYNYYCGPFNARLNRRRYGRQGGAWCSKRRDRRQWLQVDFGALSTVSGVATQGRQNSAQWVTSYYISYSRNGYKFAPYREGRRTRVRALACLFYLFYLFATQ